MRLNGLFWDAPYFFNPDEKRLISWGMELDYFQPGVSEWGPVPLLLVRLATRALGLFYPPVRADIYLVARGFSVLLGGVIVFLVYRLAKKGYGRQSALYAAIFTAFTVLLIQYAHFYSLDSIFAFAILVALFPIFDVGASKNFGDPGKPGQIHPPRVPQPVWTGQAQTGRLKSYILSGLAIGLAMAVRLNGIFLFAPLLVAHYFNARRRRRLEREGQLAGDTGRRPYLTFFRRPIFSKGLLLALLCSLGVFVILTPSSVLNPEKFLFHDGLVWILLQSKGYLKSQYTLQFEGTAPWYYVSNLLFWAAGPFLLLAYGVGLGSALFKWRKPENLIILSFLLIYFWTAAGSRVKFIRYVLPALPLLNIIAAEFFATAQRVVKKKPVLKWSVAGWLGVTVTGSALYALAFANIYSRPDIRIIAAQWIQDNIPAGSTIVHENDVIYAPPLGFYGREQSRYNFREIDFYDLYQSSSLRQNWSLPAYLDKLDIEISRRGKSEVPAGNRIDLLSGEQKQQYLEERIYCADYIIFSDRHYSVYRDKEGLFPVEAEYYRSLFDGQLGFRPIKTFERRPNLMGWAIDDSQAELTFRIFDHPAIWIFQAQLPREYLGQHPPQNKMAANWANQVRLAGYDIDKRPAQPGEEIELTLYWETLADMSRDYTIFLQLQDDAHQIVAQNDYQVAGGLQPTSCWRPGRIIPDTTLLSIPANAPPGNYRLKLGLYFFETLERMPLLNDASGENALSVTDVYIK